MGDLPIGSTIAGYRIESVIGRGGMGVVYLAEHLRLKARHALKVVAPEHSGDPEFAERFLREAQLAASLDHPNIIPIYGADDVDGTLFIAMRYVRGTDLGEVLEREGALEPERALSILDQVASALDAAHLQGLVHRDVKPANILMAEPSSPGSGGRVFLTDFGLTKRVDSETRLTRTGFYVGTLHYSAPEQLQAKPLDGGTDQYALAAVLFECLTGIPPFVREMDAQVITAHLIEGPPSVRERRPELPNGIDEVIDRGMAKAKEDRFPSCTALLAAARTALSPALAGGPASAGAPERPETLFAPPPRPPAPAEAQVAGGEPPGAELREQGPVDAAEPQPAPTGAQEGGPRPSHRRGRLLLIAGGGVLAVCGIAVGAILALGGFAAHNRVTATIKVSGHPSAITFGNGAAWVETTLGIAGPLGARGDATVQRIGAASNRVTGGFRTSGRGAAAITFGHGAVWVVTGDSDFEEITLPENANSVATGVGKDPDGATFGQGAVWVSNSGDGTVWRIDDRLGSPKVTVPAADIKVGLFPGGLAFGDGAVWVALNSPDGRVARIDPTTNKVEKTIPVGADPVAISVGGGAVWVANSESDTVSRIDPGTERVTATVRVGKAPVDVAFGDGAVWVANSVSSTISRIDPATNRVTATIKVGPGPQAVTFGAGALWVASLDNDTVSRILP